MTPPSNRTLLTVGALTVAGAVALSSPMSAGAAHLMSGKEIQRGTVSSAQIRNGSIVSRDVKNGTLMAEDFKPGQLESVKAGPAGPAGRDGKDGKDGASAPAPTTMTWHVGYAGGSATNPTGTSQLTIPAYTRITGIDMSADLRQMGCTYASINLGLPLGNGIATAYESSGTDYEYLDDAIVGSQPTTLQWSAGCSDGQSVQPVPAFDVTVTFETVSVQPTAAAEFN